VQGTVLVFADEGGVRIRAHFTVLPAGKHGFHIHKAGDMRGSGCKGACEHWHVGPGKGTHGPRPGAKDRHTGDLGNVEIRPEAVSSRYSYVLEGVKVSDFWGRSIIVHEGEDDLGRGDHEDSKTTGHSGGRLACAVFGRVLC